MTMGASPFVRVGLSATLVLATVSGQSQGPIRVPGAIRSRVTLVPVEVSVTDRAGRPIRDLKAGDFAVFEDGIRQEISEFSTREYRTAQGVSEPGASVRVPDVSSATAGRTFLILLGRGRLDEPSRGMAALEDFVRRDLGPRDLVAVMAYSRVTDLTQDRDAILRLIAVYRARYKLIEMLMDEWFTGLTLVFAGSVMPTHIQKEIDLIFETPGLPPHRELPIARPSQDSDLDEMQRLLQITDDPNSLLDDDAGQRLQKEGTQDWEALCGAVEYLRHRDGPKHLIYVTEKPLFQDMTRLAERANDAGVSIWPLQTGGNPGVRWTSTYPPRFVGPPTRDLFALLGLRAVADQTGGRASIQEYSDKGLRILESATRFQYVIGYYPSRREDDGRYHKLRVEVRRRDFDVRHRSGYFARERVVPTDLREYQSHLRLLSASQHWRDITDIGLTWQDPAITMSPERRSVAIQLTITPSSIVFAEHGGVNRASLDVAVFALDGRGRALTQRWQTVDLTFDSARLVEIGKSGIPYRDEVAVTPGVRTVRVAVYQFSTDKAGSLTLRIPR